MAKVEMPVVVSFYVDWPERTGFRPGVHERDAGKLVKNCESVGLSHWIKPVAGEVEVYAKGLFKACPHVKKGDPKCCPPYGKWPWRLAIYRYIPTFVLEALRRFPSPVLFVQASAAFHKAPDLKCFPAGMDVGHGLPSHAAPIYFNHSKTALGYLSSWKHLCDTVDVPTAEHGFSELTHAAWKYASGVQPFHSLFVHRIGDGLQGRVMIY